MTDITLKFFARLREQTGCSELKIPASAVKSTRDLNDYLLAEYPSWQFFLKQPLLTAVNQEMVRYETLLKPGDEVALFPPVTGG